VPHLRDGFIADKVGIRGTREPPSSPSETIPKTIFRVFAQKSHVMPRVAHIFA
jgi:hypothetical protein